MKKLLTCLLCLALILNGAAALAYTAGEYTVTAQGNNGPVEVKVTFDEGSILAVEVLSHSETPGICDPAIERLPAAIIQGQRDFFGAHTYQRIDKPGTFHPLWSGDRSEAEI